MEDKGQATTLSTNSISTRMTISIALNLIKKMPLQWKLAKITLKKNDF